MIVIETKRLLLRHLTLDDLNDLYRILSDPITMSFWPSPFSLEATRDWISRNIKRYQEDGFGRFAVVLRENNALIGDCGIIRAEVDGKPENDLGYIIFHTYWNRGYAVEAAEACKTYGFDALNLNRICANMPVDHLASRRVAEKIGMHLEKEFHNKRNRGVLTCLYSIGTPDTI